MTRILLVRHGRTDWNIPNDNSGEERLRGRKDLELNKEGKREARALAKRLSPLKIEAIYSSPLRRAYETAALIGEPHGLKPQPEKGFIDIDYGEWQGLSLKEINHKYPDLYSCWLENPRKVEIPGGEDLSEIEKRSSEALERILDTHPRGDVVVVAHKVVNKVVILRALGLDSSYFWQVRQDNTALNVLDYQNTWLESEKDFTITLLNDTCHLE